MCGISAGNNGYPLSESTRVALKTIRKWLEQGNNVDKFDKIVFVCYYNREVKEYPNIYVCCVTKKKNLYKVDDNVILR